MSTIQQAPFTVIANLAIGQAATTQKSLSINSVKSSATKHLTASGISDQQGASARTVSTETFLSEIGKATQGTTATDGATATMPNSTSNLTSVRESLTVKAGVVTSNKSFTLSEHINSPTQQTQSEKETGMNRGVKRIASCLSDYYVQNNNGTIAHKLINICDNTTVVSGYVDPKCSVSSPPNNPLNIFTLNKQGDLHAVEIQHTDNCEQAIQLGYLPTKLGDCLYGFRIKYDEYTFEDKVINGCKGTVAKGYAGTNSSIRCQVNFSEANPSAKFTLNPSEVFTIRTFRFCNKAIFEGEPPIKISACLQDFVTVNNNGTATHKVIDVCYGSVTYGHLRKGCTVNSPPNNEWNHFGLSKNAQISFLVQDKQGCEAPVRYGNPPITSYEKLYCSPSNASLADLPKAEKIVAGDGLLAQDARHLVYIANRGINFCSGSLISDRHVLTAAHCVKKTRTSKQSAALENLRVHHDPYPWLKWTQYVPATEYKVKAGHIFPCYVYTQENNCDLALLELEKPIVNARFVSLPTDQDFCEFAKEVDRVLATDTAFPYELSGQYDKTKPVWQEGNVLAQGFGKERDAKGNIVNSERAKQGKVVAFKIVGKDNGLISARPNNRGDNICRGDSGGALIHIAKDGRKVQVGVTCCFTDGDSKRCTGGASYTNLNNKKHQMWLKERMAEDSTSVKVKRGDLTRLRVSPDSCVEKIDAPDGFLSWLGGFTFSIQGRRRITLTNHCHNKNHPTKVNVKFYSTQGKGEKQEPIYGIEKIENVAQLDLGATRVFHTDGTAVKTVLTWGDLNA